MEFSVAGTREEAHACSSSEGLPLQGHVGCSCHGAHVSDRQQARESWASVTRDKSFSGMAMGWGACVSPPLTWDQASCSPLRTSPQRHPISQGRAGAGGRGTSTHLPLPASLWLMALQPPSLWGIAHLVPPAHFHPGVSSPQPPAPRSSQAHSFSLQVSAQMSAPPGGLPRSHQLK